MNYAVMICLEHSLRGVGHKDYIFSHRPAEGGCDKEQGDELAKFGELKFSHMGASFRQSYRVENCVFDFVIN